MQPRQQQPGQPRPPVGRLFRGGARQLPALQPPGRADGRPLPELHARRLAAVLRLRQKRARVPHGAAREALRGTAHHRSVRFTGWCPEGGGIGTQTAAHAAQLLVWVPLSETRCHLK